MSKTKQIVGVWRAVFGNWRYLFLGILIALVFYELNVLIFSFGNFLSFYGSVGLLGALKYLFNISVGFGSVVIKSTVISIVILSLLSGMLVSLLVYKVNVLRDAQKSRVGLLATTGLFLGVFAPGCASCGVGLVAALGLGASLAFLPFSGLEVAVLGIGILAFSIIKVSNGFLECEACKNITK